METKLAHMLDNLNAEETSRLLDLDLSLPIHSDIKKRIIKSIKKKVKLSDDNNFSHKFKSILGILFARNKLALNLTTFALFLGFWITVYTYLQTPTAYISLDINPSIELGINRFEKVVSYYAYNLDGQNILKDISYKNIKVEKAINNIVLSSIDKNYISNNDSFAISLSATSKDSSTRETLENNLKYATYESLINSNIDVDFDMDINSFNAPISKRDNAKDLGITIGKLTLIEELMSLSPSIKVEDYKDKSVKYIQDKINELKNKNKLNISSKTDKSSDKDIVAFEDNSIHTTSLQPEISNNNSNLNNTTNSVRNNINNNSSNSNSNKIKDSNNNITPPNYDFESKLPNHNNGKLNNRPGNVNKPNNGNKHNSDYKPGHNNKHNSNYKPGHDNKHDSNYKPNHGNNHDSNYKPGHGNKHNSNYKPSNSNKHDPSNKN